VSDFIWSPTRADVESANLTRLARKLGVEGYVDLHRISIEEPERFWPALIEDLDLEFSEPWEQVVDTSRGDEWATWFTGGKLNLAWNCVHKWAAGELAEEEAAIWHGEDGARMSLTWGELSDEVFRLVPATPSGSSCRCRRRSRSHRTPAHISAQCRCRSSPASRRLRSPLGSPTRRRRR
jgi:acetyl-CoA synthetase